MLTLNNMYFGVHGGVLRCGQLDHNTNRHIAYINISFLSFTTILLQAGSTSTTPTLASTTSTKLPSLRALCFDTIAYSLPHLILLTVIISSCFLPLLSVPLSVFITSSAVITYSSITSASPRCQKLLVVKLQSKIEVLPQLLNLGRIMNNLKRKHDEWDDDDQGAVDPYASWNGATSSDALLGKHRDMLYYPIHP